jgi:N-acyl-D-aspartate/D-glutamate deacylase
MFWLGAGDAPNYNFDDRQSLQATADANAEQPVETFLRISRETEGKALFTVRFFNQNSDALAELISTDWCMPGLGDAGAHVGQIMDAGWATFVMSHWARDAGLYSTAEAVRRITSVPARVVGLSDRGILAPGMRADVNVIDHERLHERMPQMVHDFPGGANRFIQRASGYKATICNGQIILEDDEHTGARAGEVIRN